MTTAASPRRVSWPALIALILVPLLAVAALLGLTRPDGDQEISAAVVNLDEAVTVEGQYIPMGRQLAAAMVDREGDNITWTLADAPSAAAGLDSGRYSAVVTIPKEFSASATSFSKNDADAARQATIQVQVSDNSPVTDAALAQEIARLATDTVNSTLTKGYLDGIYVGFNTVGEQFTTIVDGAKQLHDGSSQLADGAKQSSQGATQLNEGMRLLSENGTPLADGATQLSDGVGELKSGTAQLADGADQLADGVDQFAAQTPQLVDGVGQLATGADQLLTGIPDFANGAAQAIGGVGQISGGLDQVIAGLDQPQDFSQLEQLKAGADGVAAGANGLADGLVAVDQQLKGLAASTTVPTQISQGIIQGATAQGCPPELADPMMCAVFQQGLAAGAQTGATEGWKAGVGAGIQALNTASAEGRPTLIQGASQLADGATQLAGGVEQLTTELPKQTAEQMATLKGGLTQIRDGAVELSTKAQPLVDNAPAIADGATQLNDGIQQLNSQIGALPGGVQQLATGARQLSDGVAQLDGGVGELWSGAETLAEGVGQYTNGVASAAEGTSQLTDGLVQLADGAGKLDEGVGTFATELEKGADQVPTYSQQDREKLATVVAQPVSKDDSLIGSSQVPLVSLLLVSGLWLGALASFVAVRPVPRNVVASRASSVALWARSVWLPAAIVAGQGLLLGLVGGVLLEAGLGKTIGLMALLSAFGVSFVLANHALAGWLGNVGRGISVVLLVVTVALGLSSAASWLSPVGAVSPLHNGLLLVRTWLSDGSGEIGLASVAVLMGAIAAVASVMAISSRRRLTADQFRRTA